MSESFVKRPRTNEVLVNLSQDGQSVSKSIAVEFENIGSMHAACLPFLILCDTLQDALVKVPKIIAAESACRECKPIVIVRDKEASGAENLWYLLDQGAQDIVEWKTDAEVLKYVRSVKERNLRINGILNSPMVTNNLVGTSSVWRSFLYQVVEAAIYTNAPVLLLGESGTGKELISRLIHSVDPRPDKKSLILLDCTTITPELSGSEFFGHERGSYTNAVQARDGAFSLANKGTLFLDEIGELPMTLQAELLRVIQEGTFKKIGSNNWQKTEFRLISATNKDIKTFSVSGNFRQDLYYRISDFHFHVPPLRERKDDIISLANHFLKEFFGAENTPQFDSSVIDYLLNRTYSGNVRDLRQLIRRIAVKHLSHSKISIGEIPKADRENITSTSGNYINREDALRNAILSGHSLRELKDSTMARAIGIALELCNGDKALAAKKLGVTVRAFQQFWKRRN